MAAQLIGPTDLITVANPPMLVYGEPFIGKSSLACTATAPLTLDFDGGVKRSQYRKHALAGKDKDGNAGALSWGECIEHEEVGTFRPFRTLIVDTVGHMLDSLSRAVIAESPKNGSLDKGPYRDGWTAIKNRFAAWVGRQRAAGYQLVFLCHQKEEKEDDRRYFRPAIVGGSYAIVMELCDIVGRLFMQGGRRTLDCSPSDRQFAKNPAWWEPLAVPNFDTEPAYLSRLLIDAAEKLGKTAEASAALAKQVDEWEGRIKAAENVDQLNSLTNEWMTLSGALRTQVSHVIQQRATAEGLVWDKAAKRFTVKEATVSA